MISSALQPLYNSCICNIRYSEIHFDFYIFYILIVM